MSPTAAVVLPMPLPVAPIRMRGMFTVTDTTTPRSHPHHEKSVFLTQFQPSLLSERWIEVSRPFPLKRGLIWARTSRAKKFCYRSIRSARGDDVDLMTSELEPRSRGIEVAMFDRLSFASSHGAIPSRDLRRIRDRDDQVLE